METTGSFYLMSELDSRIYLEDDNFVQPNGRQMGKFDYSLDANVAEVQSVLTGKLNYNPKSLCCCFH